MQSLGLPAHWPDAHFIIGTPPFLGSKLFRAHGLPDNYIAALYQAYDLPKTSAPCFYRFKLARQKIAAADSPKGPEDRQKSSSARKARDRSLHELWALDKGTQLEDRPRYTPSTCFETFPLPWPPGKEPNTPNFAGPSSLKTQASQLHARIAAAAKELNDLRERWLNPPELLDPLAKILDATDDFSDVPPDARPLIRHSALMAIAAKSPNLKKRTLTNLYNERPTWLKLAHQNLDQAVLAAYAHIDPQGQWSESWATLYTETGAGQPLPPDHPLAKDRTETDQKILTNLLRLNHQRAGAHA